MARRPNKKNGRIKVLILVLGLILLITELGLLLRYREKFEQAEDTTTMQVETESRTDETVSDTLPMQETEEIQTDVPETEAVPLLQFPLICENGKLEIQSLFQFSGINPDCENLEGTDVAAITLHNISGQYLKEAGIVITAADGTPLQFTIMELPAGGTAMAFAVDNRTVEVQTDCVEISVQAEFLEIPNLDERIQIDVNGTEITLTNTSAENISNIRIWCRTPLDEEYFGGVAYPYEIDKLDAKESTTLEAWDCILGMTEVVRLEIGKD